MGIEIRTEITPIEGTIQYQICNYMKIASCVRAIIYW
jgi:hypothetical protein